MKKIILMLTTVLFCIDVYAQTNYTDYEFVGYTQEEKENDEFYKYEQTKLNRFYKLVETDVNYVREGDGYPQEFIDKSVFKMVEFLSTNKNLPYDKTRELTIKIRENYATHKVLIENLKDFRKVQKIEIRSDDTLIQTLEKGIDTDFEIEFGETTLEQIDVLIYYETATNIEFDLTFVNDTGTDMLSRKIVLESRYVKFSVDALTESNFKKFIEKNSLMGIEESFYHRYKAKAYKVYNLQREYVIDAEESFLEGYTFDEDESYTAYRILKREKIPEKEEPPVEEEKPNTPPVTDQNPVLPPTPTTKPDKPISTTKKKTPAKPNDNTSNSVNKNELDTEPTHKNEPYDTVDNLSKKNLLEYKSANSDMSCDCKSKVNSFTIIGLLMITASLAITGIHIYNVNHMRD